MATGEDGIKSQISLYCYYREKRTLQSSQQMTKFNRLSLGLRPTEIVEKDQTSRT